MQTIKGPGIFLAQFMGDQAPFNNLAAACKWAASLGYKAVQIPTWDPRCIDLKKAAESKTYADEINGIVTDAGLEISELSTHLQGQLVAVHPARTEWAIQQVKYGAAASRQLGLNAHPTFSGSLLWHTFHPWPQRPAGLVEEGFKELGSRWLPILNYFDDQGVDICYEVHPGEDIFDGATYELFLDAVNQHPRACLLYDPSHFVLQQLDYIDYIDLYHERIKAFHVKDAEFHSSGRQGTFGGYQPWVNRAGRYRSPGDGQVDFKRIFSKLTEYGYDGWAVMEWECCIKHPEAGAREGAGFIRDHIIRVTDKSFDDFASSGVDQAANRRLLGLD
jgi:sugar phosphate isomerase/epimerase